MSQYDLLIAQGQLIDPGSGRVGRYDLAVAGGRVAAVAPQIDRSQAAQVIDAAGQIVTPGLVDLHTHIYWGVTFWGIEPDPVAARSGVTTWFDAGSAGTYTFPGFRRYVIEPSAIRIFSFLNLSTIGLVAPTWEFANLDYCDVPIAARMVEENRDLILGIKARIDANTTRGIGIRPLELARELADRVELPLMVHISSGPPAWEEIAALLRPGDILTHCFTGGTHRFLRADGTIDPMAVELQQRGVIMDIGHGGGSFVFDVAEAALAQGLVPDVISSDIHQLSVQGPMFDLPTTLSKFLSLGMSLPDVIARATVRPAQAMRRADMGTLQVGAPADIAIFTLEEGAYQFHDVRMQERKGNRRLICQKTFVRGLELARRPERPPAIWAELPPYDERVHPPTP
jgi:dihydroorotase